MWQRVVGAAVLLASAAGQGAAMVVPVDIPEDWWLTNLLSNMFTCVCLVSCSPLKNDCVCVCVCVCVCCAPATRPLHSICHTSCDCPALEACVTCYGS
jgi:hypothetical protein